MKPNQQPVIAFIHQLSMEQEKRWLLTLAKYCPNYQILPFSAINESQYNQIEIAIVANPEVSKLNQLSGLKWVQSLWSGVEGLIAADLDSDIKVVKMKDPNLAINMANSVLTWCLYLYHKIPQYRHQQQQKKWQQHPIKSPQQTTISILGLGDLGKVAANKLKQHGFSVSAWSNSEKHLDGINCCHGNDSLSALLAATDILISLLPLTLETRYLLDQERLALLPQGAAIINFSRGAIIHQQALLDALDNNLSHAVLDVFEEEPLPLEDPMWNHPDITILPHIAAPTDIDSASCIVAANISNYFEKSQIPPAISRKNGY